MIIPFKAHIEKLKSDYFDCLWGNLNEEKKSIVLTDIHNRIAKMEKLNKELWKECPQKDLESVIEYWKMKYNVKQ